MAAFTVWRFPDAGGADRAAETLSNLQRAGLINVHDGAIVVWPIGEKKPRTRQLEDLGVAGGALSGAFWGFFFGLLFFVPLLGLAVGAASGALSKALAPAGVHHDFLDRVREQVTPGTSAIFLFASDADVPAVGDAFAGQAMELIQTSLSADEEQALRTAFGAPPPKA